MLHWRAESAAKPLMLNLFLWRSKDIFYYRTYCKGQYFFQDGHVGAISGALGIIFFYHLCSLNHFSAVAIEIILPVSVPLCVMTHPGSNLLLFECHLLSASSEVTHICCRHTPFLLIATTPPFLDCQQMQLDGFPTSEKSLLSLIEMDLFKLFLCLPLP